MSVCPQEEEKGEVEGTRQAVAHPFALSGWDGSGQGWNENSNALEIFFLRSPLLLSSIRSFMLTSGRPTRLP